MLWMVDVPNCFEEVSITPWPANIFGRTRPFTFGAIWIMFSLFHGQYLFNQNRVKYNPTYCGLPQCCVSGNIIMENQISPKYKFIENISFPTFCKIRFYQLKNCCMSAWHILPEIKPPKSCRKLHVCNVYPLYISSPKSAKDNRNTENRRRSNTAWKSRFLGWNGFTCLLEILQVLEM